MPSLPPGRLTFGQIRNFALRKAGNRVRVAVNGIGDAEPGRSTGSPVE